MSADPTDLLRRIDAFAQDARTRDLLAEEALGPLGAALRAARATGLDRPLDRLLVIMLCGPTAVGKSSLLNALAGATIAPTGLGATTTAPLVYLHAADDPARLFAYGQALGELAGSAINVVRHSSAALLHKVIVDTPDIDSAVRAHRAITEAAVARADIVLYVTSPEKYKVAEPLRWLASHRRRHGLAFVLNKWDAEGMGLQFARRGDVAEDFRALIGTFGFTDPFLFFVSVRDRADSDGARGFARLQDWITGRLDASTAVAVGARAQRASWGEIAAALHGAVAGLSGTPDDLRGIERIWDDAIAAAKDVAQAEASRLAAAPAPAAYRPQSPGLLGLAMAAWPQRRALPAPDAPPEQGTFGAAALGGLRRAAGAAEILARTRRLRLGGVPAEWDAQIERLAQDLARVPVQAEAEVMAASLRARPRRALAKLWLGVVELSVVGVLALTLWRLASDFVAGRYAPFSLLVSAAAIVALLALFGQMGVRLLFPTLSGRIAARARQYAAQHLDAAGGVMVGAAAAQVEAAVRLRESGAALLADIDREIAALALLSAENDTAARLFATDAPEPPKRAAARFD
jgi:energy-coupling factor transporter ATP-binding protein EcfA2